MPEMPCLVWWRSNLFIEHICCELISMIVAPAMVYIDLASFRFCPFCGAEVRHEDILEKEEFQRRFQEAVRR